MDTTSEKQVEIARFVQSMPKAELHIHLEGSISPKTVYEIAKRNHLLDLLPGKHLEDISQWFLFRDFTHFVEVLMTIQQILRTSEDFATVAYECGADMHAQNIAYREITLTPYTHIVHQDKGLTLDDVLLGLEKGRKQAFDDFGVEMRWVFDIHRNLAFSTNGSYDYDAEPAERTLDFAIAGKKYGVVGLGLGGDEVNAPPEPFADVFYRAKDAGLLSVPHAGETEGPNSVKGAVTHLYADRIGHGVRAIEDPAVVELVKEKQIPLEVNISSNVCLHVYSSIEEHPFKRLDQAGVLLTVNSDDPPLFSTTLSKEYEILAGEFGYTLSDLVRFARNAFLVSGAELEVKKRLLNKFDAWVSSVD